MLKTKNPSHHASTVESWRQEVVRVCLRVPPVWDLRNYVAVNPFMGFAARPIDSAARIVADGLDADLPPRISYYRERMAEGAFGAAELESAARRAGRDALELERILKGESPAPVREKKSRLTFAEEFDLKHDTNWNDTLIRSASRWCSVHASKGGRYWRFNGGTRLFTSWRESATIDRSLEISGLRGFRSIVESLPESPELAIDSTLRPLGSRDPNLDAYLYRLIGGVYGWASYFRRIAWENDPRDPGEVLDLLAIRLCMDFAVKDLATRSNGEAIALKRSSLARGVLGADRDDDRGAGERVVEDESTRFVFQNALEDGFMRRLIGEFRPPVAEARRERPEVQAVFCIDVRSEPLRRALEIRNEDVETLGFAGFFGVPLGIKTESDATSRCPVLIKPSFSLERSANTPWKALESIINHIQSAPASLFSFVEILGILYGLRIMKDTAAVGFGEDRAEETEPIDLASDDQGRGIPREARLDLAASILKNIGFGERFARIVLLCGHVGNSTNNPHASGLHCGACGGYGGGINARVAAAILNDPEVRSGLSGRGFKVPDDVLFVPAVHDTSTDDVRPLDRNLVPPERRDELDRLISRLEDASAHVRVERARSLGLDHAPAGVLKRILRRRANDWSEVRPEWGLSRNAAFIAARRSRTRGADLKGRVFLHEYDSSIDHDDSVLAMILSAPVVVASWINLQYFASTVDNSTFGAGDKAIHNRVGSLGVVLGNGGDLRTGLALQSVRDVDGRWFHEPLRLQVVVEASREKIERVVRSAPGVSQLVENGWIRIFALDPDRPETALRVPGSGWEMM